MVSAWPARARAAIAGVAGVLGVLAVGAACKRGGGAGAVDAGATGTAGAGAVEAGVGAGAGVGVGSQDRPSANAPVRAPGDASAPSDVASTGGPFVPVEAERARFTFASPPHGSPFASGDALGELRRHFAAAAADAGAASAAFASLVVESVPLTAAGRRAWLFEGGDAPHRLAPYAVVTDERGHVLWSKDRAIGGITPPVGELALASGPSNRVVLAACDAPTSSVAARVWDDDGTPFADFEALELDGCEHVSVLYWPRHGWIIVASTTATGPRAQLLTESGRLAFGGSAGVAIGATWRAAAPVSLALDTPESFVAVQYARSPDHALAFRYDANGAALWPAPVDLGAVAGVKPGSERVPVARPRDGVVRATLADGAVVEIGSSGDVLRR